MNYIHYVTNYTIISSKKVKSNWQNAWNRKIRAETGENDPAKSKNRRFFW